MASVQLVSQLKTEGAPQPPVPCTLQEMKPRFTRPGLFSFAHRIEANIAKLRGSLRRNPKPAERVPGLRVALSLSRYCTAYLTVSPCTLKRWPRLLSSAGAFSLAPLSCGAAEAAAVLALHSRPALPVLYRLGGIKS
jgi:hypothetical protein